MRVALVDPSLFTLPYDVALARGLSEAGLKVTLHARAAHPMDGCTKGVAIAPHFYPLAESRFGRALPKAARLSMKGLDHLLSMRRLLSVLRADKPGIIHFQWLPLPMIDSHLLSGFRQLAPVVLTVHDTNPFNGNPAARLQSLGVGQVLRSVDRLIVHTAQGRCRLLAQDIAAEKIDIVPHGSLSHAQAGTHDDMQGVLTLLLFGKIKPYKGADVLIAAFAALPPGLRAGARIRIVGRPYMDLDELRAQAASLGIADAVSIEPVFVADDAIDAVFGPGTIAVFPYREIEASGVLSYAIANGRPIIASSIGSFAETLTDGVHGHLVPVADMPALTQAMAHMLADRAGAARQAAAVARLAQNVPSWSEIGLQTARIYASMARPAG